MVENYKMLINGEWVHSSSGEKLETTNPFNQEVWATIPQASERDIDAAIDAARTTFNQEWKYVNGAERARLMNNLADLLDRDAERMAILETTDNGKVIRETKNQMHFAARGYRFFAGAATKIYGQVIPLDNPELFDYTRREPIGVAVLVTSWNSPISLIANKLAPALAAGNTVVIKPSESASVTTLELGKLIEEAGFPKGVVNIVTGDGKVGDYLTNSPKVNKISFTGGTETGKRIAVNAGKNLVPVTLELGGKSPNIIFADAEIDKAVIGAVAGIYAASGQTCIAGSRLLVHESIYEEVVEKVVQKAKTIKLGNPLEITTEMGPAANEAQYHKILGMIKEAKEAGAELVLGGGKPTDPALEKGYFIEPTIFTNVDNKMKIAQEEVFGPVLSIISFQDDDEALAIANNTEYGLASGIWTTNMRRVHRFTKEIEAGTVWVNTYRTASPQAPFGGIKSSGYGRERSLESILEYTHVKNVMINFSEDERDPFSIQV